MPTIDDVLRYEVAQGSKRIREIKDAALKVEKRQGSGWFLDQETNALSAPPKPDESAFFRGIKGLLGFLVPKDTPRDRVRWSNYEYEVVVSHINPNHELWPEYVTQKRNVSIALTAISVHRVGKLDAHLPKGITRGEIICAAQTKIDRIKKAIPKGAHQHVDAWAKEAAERRGAAIKA